MLALFLDQHNRVLAVTELSRGTLAQNAVYIRDVPNKHWHITPPR